MYENLQVSCSSTAVARGASDVHLKVGRPPIVRYDGELEPLQGWPALDPAALDGGARARRRLVAVAARRLREHRRARHRLPGRRPAALPRERVPPARRDLVRVPRHPRRGSRLREPAPARRRPEAGRGAPRADPRHRRHRRRQDDDARRDARAHQPHPPAAHRHDRGPDRVPPRGRPVHREPARGRDRHRVVPRGAPACAAAGPGRDPDRRAARPRDRRDGTPGRGVRSSRALDDAHPRRGRDARPPGRVLPGGQADRRCARSSQAS